MVTRDKNYVKFSQNHKMKVDEKLDTVEDL